LESLAERFSMEPPPKEEHAVKVIALPRRMSCLKCEGVKK